MPVSLDACLSCVLSNAGAIFLAQRECGAEWSLIPKCLQVGGDLSVCGYVGEEQSFKFNLGR